jgi:hypothetical protein
MQPITPATAAVRHTRAVRRARMAEQRIRRARGLREHVRERRILKARVRLERGRMKEHGPMRQHALIRERGPMPAIRRRNTRRNMQPLTPRRRTAAADNHTGEHPMPAVAAKHTTSNR